MKKIAYSILLLGAFAFTGLAQDRTDLQSGATRNFDVFRWSRASIGNNSPTMSGLINATNVISTSKSILGKVIFVPSSITDNITIYDANAASNCNATAAVFYQAANSPTMGNSPTAGVNIPFVTELGIPCSNGVVAVSSVPVTATANKAWLLWDKIK